MTSAVSQPHPVKKANNFPKNQQSPHPIKIYCKDKGGCFVRVTTHLVIKKLWVQLCILKVVTVERAVPGRCYNDLSHNKGDTSGF